LAFWLRVSSLPSIADQDFIGKDHGRSVFVPFSNDVPDDGLASTFLQIILLAQSGQKGERIEESFHPLELKILIHLIERFPDLGAARAAKRFVLGPKRIHEAKDEAHGPACYAKTACALQKE